MKYLSFYFIEKETLDNLNRKIFNIKYQPNYLMRNRIQREIYTRLCNVFRTKDSKLKINNFEQKKLMYLDIDESQVVHLND